MSVEPVKLVTPTTTLPTPQVTEVLSAMLMQLQNMNAAVEKRQVKGIDEVMVITPFDPTGSVGGERAHKLRWEHVYQNGGRLDPALLHDEEIDLLNQLKKSGRYNKGKWGVSVRKHDRTIDISYYNKSVEQRMDLSREAREGAGAGAGTGFAGMLRNILMEQESRDERRKKGLDEFDDE